MENRLHVVRERAITLIEGRDDLTFGKLAQAVGLSRQWASMFGKRKRLLTLEHVPAAAAYLGVRETWLLGYDSLDSDLARQTGRGKKQPTETGRKAGAPHVVVAGSDEARRIHAEAENAKLRKQLAQLRDFIDDITDVADAGGSQASKTDRATPTHPAKDGRRNRGRR